jgi:hypothetical protein
VEHRQNSAAEQLANGASLGDLSRTLGVSRYRAMSLLEDYLVEHSVTDPYPWVDSTDFETIRDASALLNERTRTKTISRYLDGAVSDEAIEIALICIRNAELSGA